MRSLLFPVLSPNIKPGPHDHLDMSHSLSQGLSACWLFNYEGAGTSSGLRIRDYTGNEVNLSHQSGTPLYGPGLYPGGVWKPNNSAILTKTTSDEVKMSNLVFSAVVEVVHTVNNDTDMFFRISLSGGQLNCYFYYNGTGRLYFSYRNDSAVEKEFFASHTPTVNLRYQYAAVSTAGGVALYINGVSQSVTGTHAGTPTGDGAGALLVSGQAGASQVSGWMESLRIYSARSLSGDDVRHLYQNPFAGFVITDPRAEALIGGGSPAMAKVNAGLASKAAVFGRLVT